MSKIKRTLRSSRRRFLILLFLSVSSFFAAIITFSTHPRGYLLGGIRFILTQLTRSLPIPEKRRQESIYRKALAETSRSQKVREELPIVVKAKRAGIVQGVIGPDSIEVTDLVSRSVLALTSEEDIAEAYRSLVNPQEKVAVRLSVSVHSPVVEAVVRGLIESGVRPNNIVLFQSFKRGRGPEYEPYRAKGIKHGVRIERNVASAAPVSVGTFRVKLARALDECTALITIAALNTHVTMEFTGALKSHMGSIDKPELLHSSFEYSGALLNHLVQIRERLRLVVLDALRPSLWGHPDFPIDRYYMESGTIIVSRDPVAADFIGLKLLKDGRRMNGLSDRFSFASKQLTLASDLGLGQVGEDNIQLVDIGLS